MKTINPATAESLAEYEMLSPQEVQQRLEQSHTAYETWKTTTFATRSALLQRIADRLESRVSELARLMTLEMGKPISQAESEVQKCTRVCRHYADHAERYLTPESISTEHAESYVRFDPLGPILAIMPWNFPYWQVFRHIAPAVMAGNTVVLKHASSVFGVARKIEELCADPKTPDGLVTNLMIEAKTVESVIEHDVIQAVTLTGSEKAGAIVAAQAGKALKKVVLELGGSDPFIVLADADLSAAVEWAVKARTQNTGQSCIAAKRFLVDQRIADEFAERMVAETRKLSIGDPLDPKTDIGPLCREDLRDELHEQVRASIEAGAELRLGGEPIDRAGFFYAPTILTNVRPGMPVFDEETFGPVAAITKVANADEAVELANRSRYGLGGSVFTRNLEQAKSIAGQLECGTVAINGMVASDPRLPFGGIKQSGFGRELGQWGIREFVNVKTVTVE